MIRVVLVDDQPLVRAGLRTLLELAPDITVVAEAEDGATGFDAVARYRPDVVLMDVRMPGTDGLVATRRIMADPGLRGAQVVVLTTFDNDDYLFEAIRLGAAGFLLKDTSPDELRRAVRLVHGGDALLSPAVTRRVLASAATANPTLARHRLDKLTERERDVLRAVGTGRSNDEIAAELFISSATARTHVSRLLAKLGARDRAQLVVLAYETGLVAPGQQPAE
ncbi:DNA-binding response regulator, NarL/FixJ family, contains REC and HTH domains [Amycolatopsis arida]|uniref:DNA-binding response regulator, NarL/FixJ family, contains REC and HTH domains n=1 Tax=Amycolatopsis arida TaxID=587909 RepID=A0A1I6A878_9PSEU|nr:response regulator transcription factor [Amycolatopsis arida]TDX88537.1 DNA-binding NarL/FixJ family response regulator [Amycolatopsis arida]SFQ64767.1 DNA-binding response regulator, NarL/FixJ family, contains REC and HTH domains [Amycolatopsis arida]